MSRENTPADGGKAPGPEKKELSTPVAPGLSLRQAFQQAMEFSAQGQLQQAEEMCAQVLAVYPAEPDTHYLLGQIKYQRGEFESAIKHIQKAADAKPNDADILFNLGIALKELGNFREAEENYHRALSLKPGDAEVLNSLGAVLCEQGRLEEATASFREAISLQPDYAEALSNLGNVLGERGRLEEAASLLNKAISIQPDYGDAHYNLGVVLKALRRPHEAAESYGRALSFQPADTKSLINLGNVLRDLKQHKESLAAYDKALTINPNSAAGYYNRGLVFWDLQLFAKARASFERAREIDPDNFETYFQLARISAMLGSFDQGEELMQSAISLCPNKQKILETTGDFYILWEKPEKALEAYSEAIKLNPTSVGSLAGLSKFAPQDQGLDLCSLINQARKEIHPNDIESRVKLDFAHANARDTLQDYPNAWSAAVAANSDYIAYFGVGTDSVTDFVPHDLPDAWCNAEVELPASGDANELPLTIFVVGLPRSGKSTAEKLIVNLELVQRGYEINIIDQTLTEFHCRNLADLRESDMSLFRIIYNKKIRDRSPGQPIYCVTISSTYFIGNFTHIFEAVPNCLFVFLNRNIWDNALRVFFSEYIKGVNNYSYRLSSIMKQIQTWRGVIDWWSNEAPRRSIVLNYEDVIDDPHAALSRICALCRIEAPVLDIESLPDDRDCAKPYKQVMQAHLKSEGWQMDRSH